MSHPFSEKSFQNHTPRRNTVDIEEQRAWVGFYKRVGRDTALAAEVMAQLDGDAEMKRRHLALYLSCKQSLRVRKARQARDKRIGQWLRLLVHWVLLRPAAFVGIATHRAYHRSADILAETTRRKPQAAPATLRQGEYTASAQVSDSRVEPATAQVRQLLADEEFADARARFQRQAGLPPISPINGSEEGSAHDLDTREETTALPAQISRR